MRQRVLWTVLAAAAIAMAATGLVDDAADGYAQGAFKRALITFAAARALNGAISVVQGTELALEPGGVGVVLGVGQILDPINDLVEQFSGVMLVATSSLGLQNVLLEMSQWRGFSGALALAGLAAIASMWWPGGAGGRYRAAATRVLLVALVVRFIVPALVIGTNVVAVHFLEPGQTAATVALEATSQEIEALNDETGMANSDPNASTMDRLGTTLREALRSMDIEGRIARLKAKTVNASEHIVNLIVLFALQTIILPVVFLWLIVELLKGAVARTAASPGD